MKYWLAYFCLPWLLAAAPAPLTTGAVRDQYGEPVAGAVVSGGGAVTVTQADGTFALAADARNVRITCAYCEPASADVDQGVAAAIVRRYRALVQPAPSAADLQALPYAHAESAISLAPFVVLEQSGGALPGPRISYYGASRFGSLLVDDGVPSYDIAAGVTPFRMLPAYGVSEAARRDPADAFRYGDMAGGGTFFTSTQSGSGTRASAAAGSGSLFTMAQTAATAAYAASASGDGDESRSRIGAWVQSASNGASLTGEAFAADDRIGTDYGGSARSSQSAVRAHYEAARAANVYADAAADSAGYAALSGSGYPVQGRWSDVALQAGASTGGAIAAFADAGFRTSTGFYDAQSAGAPRVAGSIVQTHVSAGVQSDRGTFTWRAGVGAFDVAYGGGSNGTAQPLSARLIAPSLSMAYAFSPQWNLAMESGASFRLPALTETYVFPAAGPDLAYDRYATQTALLSYSDLHRVRVSVTAMHRNVAGLDDGPVNAAGAAIEWQIAPALSLRAWTLRTNDESIPVRPLFRFGATPLAATPASLWLTYEAPGGFRADAIWRRDLIDYRPDPHLDASIGAPIAGPMRWFAATERRAGERYFEIGLRYDQ